jgi:hypothetical protein
MNRGKLISCFCLIALFSAACEQPPPAPPPIATGQAPMFLSCASQGIDYINDPSNAGNAFVSTKVSFLPSGFDPRATGKYNSPQCNSRVSDPYLTSLSNAFRIAPPFFKEHLCGLTCVFINQEVCQDPQNCTIDEVAANSWGFREQQSQSNAAGRYIATSQGLWNRGSSPDNLSDYETKVLNRLLASAATSGLKHDPAMPNNGPEMTVLAALAHELGHVRWFDANVMVPGGNYEFTYTIPCVNSTTSFFDNSWYYSNTAYLQTPNRWRYFGDWPDVTWVINRNLDHKNDPKFLNIFGNISDPKKFGKINNGLHLANQPWASFFGSRTPDEDFVETYRLWVLRDAGLTSFAITIPYGNGNNSTKQNIVDDLRKNKKGELKRKIDCVAAIPS